MISIVVFDSEAVIRIAKRTAKYFSDCKEFSVSDDTLWLSGLYIKFYPRMITVNVFNTTLFSIEDIFKCLKYILKDEEVFISDYRRGEMYIDSVNAQTSFDQLLSNTAV